MAEGRQARVPDWSPRGDGGGRRAGYPLVNAHAISAAESSAALVNLLERSKNRFTPADRAAKRAALLALADRSLQNPALLLRFHEALCFLRAYPDDAELLQLVESALERFGARAEALKARRSANAAEALDDTGMAGTAIRCPLSYPAARWLATRFPEGAEIDWEDGETEERLGALLPYLVNLADEEALVEMGVPYRAWVAAAKGTAPGSDLGWILGRLDGGPIPGAAGRSLYDGLQLRTRWELGEAPASRTLAKVPGARIFFHRSALLRWRGSLNRRLQGPRIRVRRATPTEAATLLDTARAAVVVRYREVYGFNFADPGDILVADVGRGVQIAWFGLHPEHRLPLRAHYGYLLLKNGVPIGYGDASLLCDWADIAFNIFETFRAGESAVAFGRVVAFLYQHLKIRTFHLDRYQIGYGNDEAIASGAFWFYYKLGFRSKRPDLRRLAAEERRHIARDPTYRSTRETLGQLCRDGMVLNVGGRATSPGRDFNLHRLGLRAAAQAGGDPGRDIAATVARALGVRRWRAWSRVERRAFERLAPVLAAIPDLPEWSLRDRRSLVDIIRAKAGPGEVDFLRHTRAHGRLRDSLLRLGAPEPHSSRT